MARQAPERVVRGLLSERRKNTTAEPTGLVVDRIITEIEHDNRFIGFYSTRRI